MKSPHPLDAALDDAYSDRQHMLRLFSADGVICEAELAALRLVDRLRAGVLVYRQRQQAGESFERNGTSDHTVRLMRDCGIRLKPLERDEGKVIRFPGSGEPQDIA